MCLLSLRIHVLTPLRWWAFPLKGNWEKTHLSVGGADKKKSPSHVKYIEGNSEESLLRHVNSFTMYIVYLKRVSFPHSITTKSISPREKCFFPLFFFSCGQEKEHRLAYASQIVVHRIMGLECCNLIYLNTTKTSQILIENKDTPINPNRE
jgi:hypothetical protein